MDLRFDVVSITGVELDVGDAVFGVPVHHHIEIVADLDLGRGENDVGVGRDHRSVAENDDVAPSLRVSHPVLDDLIIDLEDLEEAIREIGGEDVRCAALGVVEDHRVRETLGVVDALTSDAVREKIAQRDGLELVDLEASARVEANRSEVGRAVVAGVDIAPPHEVEERRGDLDGFAVVVDDINDTIQNELGVLDGGAVAAGDADRSLPPLIGQPCQLDGGLGSRTLLPGNEDGAGELVHSYLQGGGGDTGGLRDEVLVRRAVGETVVHDKTFVGWGDPVEFAVPGQHHVARGCGHGRADQEDCDEYGSCPSHGHPLRFTTEVRSVERKTSMISSLIPTSG